MEEDSQPPEVARTEHWEKALGEFKELYFRRFGVSLSDEDATKKAVNLLTLCRLVFLPQDQERPEEERKGIIPTDSGGTTA